MLIGGFPALCGAAAFTTGTEFQHACAYLINCLQTISRI